MERKYKITNMQAYGDCATVNPRLFTSITNVFESLHDKELVSIGSSLRRLISVMITMTDLTDTTWAAMVLYKPKTNIFIFRYNAFELDITIDLVSSCELGTRKDSVIKAVNDAFYHDKTVRYPVSYLSSVIHTNVGDFNFEKKLIGDPEVLAVWRCTPNKTLWQRLFTKKVEEIEIGKTDVVIAKL